MVKRDYIAILADDIDYRCLAIWYLVSIDTNEII